ncbi:hypothetical protein Pfo_010166 [Paulownia fortunei]|nr:hypothetical protein Pfo_010166 [Paulownia fortunei]
MYVYIYIYMNLIRYTNIHIYWTVMLILYLILNFLRNTSHVLIALCPLQCRRTIFVHHSFLQNQGRASNPSLNIYISVSCDLYTCTRTKPHPLPGCIPISISGS